MTNKFTLASKYEYEIALSFAGEERDYVENVAILLREKDIKFFYDQFEEASLWGKDLYDHLDQVYRSKAQYSVLFLSKNYAAKVWTNHERKSAQTRAFKEQEEYILPARFDDTEIPGISSKIFYIDLRGKTPEQLVDLIIQKLDKSRESIKQPDIIIEVAGEISSLLGNLMGDKRINRLFPHLSVELEDKTKQEQIYHVLTKSNNIDDLIIRLEIIVNVHRKSFAKSGFMDNFNLILNKLNLKLDNNLNVVKN